MTSTENFHNNVIRGCWAATLDPSQTWVPPAPMDLYGKWLEMTGIEDSPMAHVHYTDYAQKLWKSWKSFRSSVDGVPANVLLYRTGIIKESLGI